MSIPIESALIIPIPEAEPLVASFRNQHDPAAALGVPAHVTVLYPFKPPAELTAEVLQQLGRLFSSIPGFAASFRELRQFPGVLYLAPEPAAPFRHLTERVFECFPEAPPYGGQFAEIIPHLTVAHASDPRDLSEILIDVEHAAMDRLPIEAGITSVTLMENVGGYWHVRDRFALGRME